MKINRRGSKQQSTYRQICKHCGCDFQYSKAEREESYLRCPQCNCSFEPTIDKASVFGGIILLFVITGVLLTLFTSIIGNETLSSNKINEEYSTGKLCHSCGYNYPDDIFMSCPYCSRN